MRKRERGEHLVRGVRVLVCVRGVRAVVCTLVLLVERDGDPLLDGMHDLVDGLIRLAQGKDRVGQYALAQQRLVQLQRCRRQLCDWPISTSHD